VFTIDDYPFPKGEPDAQKLIRIMAGLYGNQRSATELTAPFGVDDQTIRPGLAPLELWDFLLTELAKAGKVRECVQAARDAYNTNPYVPFLDQLLSAPRTRLDVSGDFAQGDRFRWCGQWQADLGRRITEAEFSGPFQVEALGDQYVERPALLARARASWLATDAEGLPRVTRAAFHGLPGSGKSVMARAFAHDAAVRRVFRDGVLSATLGRDTPQTVDVTRLQSAWGRALRDNDMPPAGYPDHVTGASQLRSLLQDRSCLLVLDDVWNANDIRPLLVGGPRCLHVATTRQLDVVDAIGASGIELSSMTAPEALTLIEQWCGQLSESDREIAFSLGNDVEWLPLALELMAAQARQVGWTAYRERWRTQKLKALRRGRRSAGREDSVADSLELSYQSLAADADWYRQLAVFGANTRFPASAAAALWNVDEAEADDALRDFSGQALLDRVGQSGAGRYMLHSLLHEFLIERPGSDLVAAHSALLAGYLRRSTTGWAGVPDDGYFGERLAFHLVAAGRVSELWALLDRPWMQAQFDRGISHAPFLADLRVGLQAARRDPVNVAAFVRCEVIHMILSALVADDPPNLPAALAALGEVERALSCAGTMSKDIRQTEAYIDVANALLERNRPADALVAAERALAAAENGITGYAGIKMLAKAATCLARCGRDSSAELARARVLSREGPADSGRVDGLAAVVEGYAALNRPDMVAEVARQMLDMIADAGNATWMFNDSANALQTAAPQFLGELRDMAVARLREGAGGYPLFNVAPALAASGNVEAAIAAARQIPDKRELIGALGKIAAIMAGQGRTAEALPLVNDAVRLLEPLLRASISNWDNARELLNAIAALGAASSMDHLQTLDVERDPVWHSWFLAGLARAHKRSGTSAARVTELARESVRVLREGSRRGPLIVGEAAGFLAEADALTEAVAIATDIEAGQFQKQALVTIAMHLLSTGRSKDARDLLLKAMVAGRPDPVLHSVNLAHGAKALARVGDTQGALRTIEPCLQRMAALQPESAARAEVLTLAVELFELCDQPERARQAAAVAVGLVAPPFYLWDRLRRQIFYLVGKTIGVEPLESFVSRDQNWFHRRTIAAGAIRAFNATGQPDRSRQFFDDLDADRQLYPPWNEGVKGDALARMFEIPDDQLRHWVREAADAVQTPAVRSVLLANYAGTLAKEGRPDAIGLARSALDLAARIEDQPAREQAFAELARVYARAGQTDLVFEALAEVLQADAISQAIGDLAIALVEQRRSAEAVVAVRKIAPGSPRNFWISVVGERLLRAQQYDEAIELFGLMGGWTEAVVEDFRVAHTAVAMARNGQVDEAYRSVEPVVRRAEARPAIPDSSSYSLVTAESALALAYVGAHDRSLALANRAALQDSGKWGPFVSCAVAACYALAGDEPRAREHSAETIQTLRLSQEDVLPFRLEMIGRTWSGTGPDEGESLLNLVRGIDAVWVRVNAIKGLAAGMASLLSADQLHGLIDVASAIEEVWPRVRALQGLAEAGAACRNRSALQRVLDLSSRIDNTWASGDLIVTLTAAAADLKDEDLLTTILSRTSELSAKAWKSAAAIAAAARVLIARGDLDRAHALTRRLLEIAKDAAKTDHQMRVAYEAERVSCLALLGRESDARAAIDAVIEGYRDIPAGLIRDLILLSFDIVLEEAAPPSVLEGLIRAAAERPDIVLHAAVHLARQGRNREASEAIGIVLEHSRLVDASERTSVLFQRASALAALNRSDESMQCALDALDSGRTLPAQDYSVVLANLAEVLADLGHRDGVSTLVETLATTVTWWDHRNQPGSDRTPGSCLPKSDRIGPAETA
jgi:tetratricopeptide (TPR) repeat protein